ncbi:MAG: hypothetical protein JNK52_09895 [Zoogloeaceae bacterium]|nr:hypothetical protein [Zoogloeaceae bacterium]
MMKWIQVLWPSFLIAGIGAIIFFTVVDPQELYFMGEPVHFSLLATYSIGFISLWIICAASSLLTIFLQQGADELNKPQSN